MSFWSKGRGLNCDEDARQRNNAVIERLPVLPGLSPDKRAVDPDLQLPFNLTYREARSLYAAYRAYRRKLEKSKSRSTFVAEGEQQDKALYAIEQARALEARLLVFIETFPKEQHA